MLSIFNLSLPILVSQELLKHLCSPKHIVAVLIISCIHALPLGWGKSEFKYCVPSNLSPETYWLNVTCKTMNTCWEGTQRIMTENPLRLAQKVVLLWHQVAENCTSCHSLTYQWVSELLNMLSYVFKGSELPLYNLNLSLWDCQVFSPLLKVL
jgi:hypothetical protein